MMKRILTALLVVGKGSIKLISEFLGHKRHDKVWRWIRKIGREGYESVMREGIKQLMEVEEGPIYLVIDDTVLDKIWGYKTAWVYKLYSGRHKRVIRGIGVVVLMAVVGEWRIPLTFRIYRKKEDGKSRIDLAREMLEWALEEVKIEPAYVLMDTWYASKDLLKYLQQKGVRYMVGVRKNRNIKVGNTWMHVEDVDIPEEGIVVYLKGVGKVKLFAFPESVKNDGQGKNKYFVTSNTEDTREDVEKLRKIRWKIEEMFKILKQLFSADTFFVRVPIAILGFITLAFRGFFLLERLRLSKGISPFSLQQRLRWYGRAALQPNRNPLFSV